MTERPPWGGDGVRVPLIVPPPPRGKGAVDTGEEPPRERSPWGRLPEIETDVEPVVVPGVTPPTGDDLTALLRSLLPLPLGARTGALNLMLPALGQQKIVYAKYTLDQLGGTTPIQTWTISPIEANAAALVADLRIDCEPDVIELEVRGAGDLLGFGAVYSSGTTITVRGDLLGRDLLPQLGGFALIPTSGKLEIIVSNTSPYTVVVSMSAVEYSIPAKLAPRLSLLRTQWQEG